MNKPMLIRELVRKLNKTFQTALARELSDIGITTPQLIVLRQIFEQPKTIGQISKEVDLSYSTVSGIIDRLERHGLVERVRDRQDRRVVWIQKTENIEEIKNKVPILRDDFYSDLLQDLSEDEQDAIIQALRLLITAIEKKVGEKP